MHAENIVEQDRGMLYTAEALNSTPPEARTQIRIGMDFAYKHWDIVRKFGRFPHRNVMMGRDSTPEEIEFLKNGRGFLAATPPRPRMAARGHAEPAASARAWSASPLPARC